MPFQFINWLFAAIEERHDYPGNPCHDRGYIIASGKFSPPGKLGCLLGTCRMSWQVSHANWFQSWFSTSPKPGDSSIVARSPRHGKKADTWSCFKLRMGHQELPHRDLTGLWLSMSERQSDNGMTNWYHHANRTKKNEEPTLALWGSRHGKAVGCRGFEHGPIIKPIWIWLPVQLLVN